MICSCTTYNTTTNVSFFVLQFLCWRCFLYIRYDDGYDMSARGTNAMRESIQLFAEICNHRFLTHSTIILLLSKHDLFCECIKKASLNVCFNKQNGWIGAPWSGPDYIDIQDNKEIDIDDIDTADHDINNSSLQSLLRHSLVRDTLQREKSDQFFISCYKNALLFIIKQYIESINEFEPKMKINEKINGTNRVHIHIANLINGDDVKSIFGVNILKWKQERLLWIAFYKNDYNSECYFKQLPKDIVKLVLLFLKKPFSIWKCIEQDHHKYDDHLP